MFWVLLLSFGWFLVLCVCVCIYSTYSSLLFPSNNSWKTDFPFGSFPVLAVVEENRGSKVSGKEAAEDFLRGRAAMEHSRGGH